MPFCYWGGSSAWAETKEKTWDLTTSSSDWTANNCETYFSQPYGIKKANAYIVNSSISDFQISGITKITIGVKSLCNGATTSKLTVTLVDSDGNNVGEGQEIIPDNASAANKTTYKYVEFTSGFTGISGFKVQCTTFGKNGLINGASYEVTYTSKSPAGLSFGETTAFNSLPSAAFTAPTLSNPNGLTVSYATTDDDIAAVNPSTGDVTIGTKEGTATITASSEETETYAAGEASYTITVTNAIHTVTFSIDGNTSRTASVVEGEEIPFPSAVASPSTANEFARENNGFTFVGWAEATITGTANSATLVTEPVTMGDADKTYYAVYAEETEEESDDVADAVLAQTLQYDTWTYSGSTTDKSNYRLFHSGSYIESAAFDLSKLMKVNI